MFTRWSITARIYYFACYFLWDALSMFYYLDEDIAKDRIGQFYWRWSDPFEKLTNWALEERYYPEERENIVINQGDIPFTEGDKLSDSLTLYFGDVLSFVATDAHQKHSTISESLWLYYYYCGFLRQVLTEFDRVLQEQDNSAAYYEHYQEHIRLFNDMAIAMEHELFLLDSLKDDSAVVPKAVRDEVNAYAGKMGAEWRQAVLSAARHLELPDFDEKAT